MSTTDTGSRPLPPGWAQTTLAEAADVVLGQSPPSSSYNDSGDGLPFFQGKAEFGDMYPTPVKWCSKPKKVAEDDAVLLSVRAPVGPTNLSPARCCIGRGLAALHPEEGMHRRYLLYALRHGEARLAKTGKGTTFKAVTGNQVRDFEISIAPAPEQQRIADKIDWLFSDLDAGVKALERVKKNLERYRASVLKAAVEGRLTADWRKAHSDIEPASELLKRILKERRRRWEDAQLAKYKAAGKTPPKGWQAKYKEPAPPDTTGLPDLPKGWCWATLDQIGMLRRGRSRHRPRDADHLYGGPYPFIQTGDIKAADQYVRQHHQTYSEAGLAQSRLWPAGTLCITIAANIADTAILSYPACFPDSVVGVEFNEGLVSVRYIEVFIRTAKAHLAAFAPATAQKNINDTTLRRVAVPLPSRAEQEAIVEEAERALSVIGANATTASTGTERGARLRQAILKRAFEGRLVPQDPNDEPADRLLERVKAARAGRRPQRKRG